MWLDRISVSSRIWIACLAVTAFIWMPASRALPPKGSMGGTTIHHFIANSKGEWLNSWRPLTANDLKARILLLDFWTYCCINCMHVIPDLKYLEDKFGRNLTVIGVHSAKFKNERDSENIRQAIIRYDIEHPVINDFDFAIWKRFGIQSWPTFVLINPRGTIEATYSGEGHRDEIERDIERLIDQYAGLINIEKMPIGLEKEKMPMTYLSFPGKLEMGWNEDKSQRLIFVSDSGHHRIVALDESGNVIYSIGSSTEGLRDGSFEEAQFRRPQGIAYSDGILYVADTENHALRKIDLKKREVTTLAGTGKQGYERKIENAPALSTPLASPWDLAFWPDNKHLAIAMAGTHQLWSYDLENQTLNVLAGNGKESIDDGTYPNNSLSQPSGLAAFGGKLYFVDAETSSLRVLENGKVTTLLGTGLFDFGFKDGKQGEALMQHPLGIFADTSGIYIADSYNHSIRRYDPATGTLSTFAGHGERGNERGKATAISFNEPNDLLKIGDRFYIADTNNHSLAVLDAGGSAASLSITQPMEDTPFTDQLPNLKIMSPVVVAADSAVNVEIKLTPGWKVNADAPSYLSLFDLSDRPKSIAMFGLETIRRKQLTLPGLASGKHYRLQGTIYYCEDKEGAQCLIRSFDVPVNPSEKGARQILLELN